jgi:hypothetical protein
MPEPVRISPQQARQKVISGHALLKPLAESGGADARRFSLINRILRKILTCGASQITKQIVPADLL